LRVIFRECSIVISHLTEQLTPDLTSFPLSCVGASGIGCCGHASMRSGHINYNNYCSTFDQCNGFSMLSCSWRDKKGFFLFTGLQCKNDR